ncbi:MAG: hypothetical protein E4H40_07075, partial [Candidatus Brocadiia bacterium]
MQIRYENRRLEQILIIVNGLASALVTATFVWLFGFEEPILPVDILYGLQIFLLIVFLGAKVVRLFNAYSAKEYLRAFWFEIPLILILIGVFVWSGLSAGDDSAVRHAAVGIYLVLQVVIKLCRTSVNFAATGGNPTKALFASFVVLIVAGAGLLVLPRATTDGELGFVDALFTATSSTCVTGLIVKDTGQDFTFMGQMVILSLIQLGGLGIVVFGAVLALLLGQALSFRESVAMQDILSARTIGRISHMIIFIFTGTFIFEAAGALLMYSMWDNVPSWSGQNFNQWFCSIFHSISAFCNAGFSLFSGSFIDYSRSWSIYTVICPLIILGGLGFGVLFDLFYVSQDRVKRFCVMRLSGRNLPLMDVPKRLTLQTKIVLTVSGCLIVIGTVLLMLFEHKVGHGSSRSGGFLGALFQSITARTAGFNTVDISALSEPSRVILILLMFIGGSPGSTAGGIKTVTLAVLIMTIFTALRKRGEVEIFKRSIRISIVGKAITVFILFATVLFAGALLLSVTERENGFSMSDIFFETASALGTVGLTTGITGSLTTAGKLIIISLML